MQEKLEVLAAVELLASSEPGSIANPAHADLFADALTLFSGLPFYNPLGIPTIDVESPY